jgi:hypothetical protein
MSVTPNHPKAGKNALAMQHDSFLFRLRGQQGFPELFHPTHRERRNKEKKNKSTHRDDVLCSRQKKKKLEREWKSGGKGVQTIDAQRTVCELDAGPELVRNVGQ